MAPTRPDLFTTKLVQKHRNIIPDGHRVMTARLETLSRVRNDFRRTLTKVCVGAKFKLLK